MATSAGRVNRSPEGLATEDAIDRMVAVAAEVPTIAKGEIAGEFEG